MKKRGQIYILVALIIGIVVFLVVSRTNIFIQEELTTDIQAIGENYVIESNKLINSLIGAKRENISDILSQATTEFVYQYAKTRDPQFGLVYVFTNQEDAVIENYLNSRVIIEAEKPGLAIGKQGSFLREIRNKTLWVPIIRRKPAIKSKLIEDIKAVLYQNSDYRRKFLDKTGHRIYDGWIRARKNNRKVV